MVNNDSVPALLVLGYECLKNTDLVNASRFFDQALSVDFEHKEVLFALKCSRFWEAVLREAEALESSLVRGDFIVSRWRNFQDFLLRIPGDFESAVYAFKRLSFGVALDHYLAIPDKEKTELGAQFEFRAGRCRKALGDYETAQQHLERAVKARKDSALFLAELADCQALSGELRLSKILFREAFYLAPEKVELEYLESDLIRRLIDNVKAMNFPEQDLRDWIPVYGEVAHVFDVKRGLSPSDSSRLNSSMFQLENDIRENPTKAGGLKPRLLNRYFWILDHYRAIEADSVRIEKILQKIRLLDEEIFKQYVS